MCQCEALDDAAAHGQSDQHGLFKSEKVEELAHVLDVHRHVIGTRRLARLTVASRVKRDDAIALSQGRRLIAPHVTAQPQPMNQHDGRPIALRLVGKSNAGYVYKPGYFYLRN